MFCLMSNFLQDALQGLDDELERFIRRLNIESELRIVNLWRPAERFHQHGTAGRQCLYACFATTAAEHVSFTATVQACPKGTITLDGTDVAFTGIVKDERHHHGMLTHGSYPIWGAVCV